MSTDTISTGIIAVDYSKSLQNMMADGSYDRVNPAITPKGFPITAVGIVQFETKVFHFNRYISSEDAVEAITADDRRNFWEPAKIEGLLAYGVKNPTSSVSTQSSASVPSRRSSALATCRTSTGAALGAVSTFFGGTWSGTVTTVSWPFANCPRSP
jgi:hypothetical protein